MGMIRFARSRPASALSKCKSPKHAIVGRRRLASAFASPRRSCRSGLGERRAWTRSCPLRGISAGDFQEVLAALLGKGAPNLSPAVIARLKGEWEIEYQRWQKRDLSARHYACVWADGVYLQARMEPQAKCMLVLIGATPKGKTVLPRSIW
jgi:Transposase, Mutator family